MKRKKKHFLLFFIISIQSAPLFSANSDYPFKAEKLILHKPSINGIIYRKLIPDHSQFSDAHKVIAKIAYINGKEEVVTTTSFEHATELIEKAIAENASVEWYYNYKVESES